MKSTIKAMQHQLLNLQKVLQHLTNEQYTYASPLLSGASIGQHSRHIIELLECLVNDYESGMVCYDNRQRDKRKENDVAFAIETIGSLCNQLDKFNKDLQLQSLLDDGSNETVLLESNYQRELLYNIDHAIHHLALIKVAMLEMQLDTNIENLGVAYATIQFRKTCAQ